MIRAIAYPVGRSEFEIEIAEGGVVEYSESIFGGFTSATVPAIVTAKQRDRLLGAKVVLFSESGAVWFGFVKTLPPDVGRVDLGLVGWQVVLGRVPNAISYCETALQNLDEYGNSSIFSRISNNGILTITQNAGTTAANTSQNCGYEIRSDRPFDTVVLDIFVANTTVCAEVFTRNAAGAATLRTTKTAGTYNGTVLTGLGGAVTLLVRAKINSLPSTPSQDDKKVTFSNIRRYGVETVRPVTASAVVNDCLSRLPVAILPAGAEYRSIETTTRVIEPLGFDSGTFDTSRLTEVNRYDATSFQFVPTLIRGEWFPKPRFRTIPTAPAYVAEADGAGVSVEFAADDLDDYASVVRARYKTTAGIDAYVDVVDPNADRLSYLPSIGLDQYDVIDVPTTDPAVATYAANLRIASKARRRNSGKVAIRVPIRNTAGREITPDQIRAGELIRLTGTSRGDVTAPIVDVKHVDDYAAELTLEAYSDDFDVLLARLEKTAERTGSVR